MREIKTNMQEFINLERISAKQRESSDRVGDFKEIYELLGKEDATTQASRCVQCGDPYCHNKCPLHNYIPYWLKSTAKMDLELSFNLSNESNPFPEITGRICPQEKLCEGDCTLNDGHGAITIGNIETFISEEGFKKGLKPLFPGVTTDKKVAIIGSGPAGIAAATYLLRSGIKVDMYERENRAGGLLTYGIPGFKLDKKIVQRRVDWLIEAGMSLYTNTNIGEDTAFDKILTEHDAVFIGIGAEKSRRAKIANESAKNVFMAIDYLRDVQREIFNENFDKKYDLKDKKVVVVGGGDTAMDCVRTALRQGAKEVTCLYRRDKHSMPGSKKEFKNARDEGVKFIYNVSPKEIVVNNDDKAIGIIMQKTIINKDGTSRGNIEIIRGSDFKVDANIFIFALGFTPSKPDFLASNGIEINKWGEIETGDDYQTSKLGVYAGGDCKRGSDLVVTAAKEGREAAKFIVKSLLS